MERIRNKFTSNKSSHKEFKYHADVFASDVAGILVNDSRLLKEWDKLAHQLEIPGNYIFQIETQLRQGLISSETAISEILKLWISASGSNATVNALRKALKQDDFVDLNERLAKFQVSERIVSFKSPKKCCCQSNGQEFESRSTPMHQGITSNGTCNDFNVDPTPNNLAKILRNDYGVVHQWKELIGYELQIMSNADMNKFEKRQNMEDYLEKIRTALKETECVLALEDIDNNLKKTVASSSTVSDGMVESELSKKMENINFLTSYQPLNIVVKKGPTYQSTKEDACIMTSDPRGFVLIVNNIKFTTSSLKERLGADNDSTYAQQLFDQLKFDVEFHQDVKNELEFDNIIRDFRVKCIKKRASSIFVIVSSHGERDAVHMSNADAVDIYKGIVYKFKNAKNPDEDVNLALQDVPKIFIINACQGRRRTQDDSTECIQRQGILSNVIVVNSTLPEYVSERDMHCGTWFMYALCKTVMEHACDMHFEDILKKMQKEVMPGIKNEKDVTQICAFSPFTFREFYFNPN